MSLKYDENADAEVLDSDFQQSNDLLEQNLKFAIMSLKDIMNWSEDLEGAKGIARYALSKMKK